MGSCNVWDILNMNNFINRQITVLPLNYTQKLVFNPFTIPGGVGKFLNFISFGIPWGWVINQDEKTWPNFQWLNGFMSANIFIVFIMMPFGLKNQKVKVIYHLKYLENKEMIKLVLFLEQMLLVWVLLLY
ncbi:hypothetical protein [Spiroplasma endosymbiont of Sarcophaga carnaria]|uniref:hypothetical protein n=1 Tax=Spiroplasma endosymbiont of Sarcophaga carnaria TaxID=3066303 RepID=UPI0030D201FD